MGQVNHGGPHIPELAESAGVPGRFSPLRFLIITIGGIFLAEVITMILLLNFQILPYYLQTLLDASIMVVMIFPLVYFLSLKPLIHHIEKSDRAEQSLLRSTELQERFFDSIDTLIAYMDRDFNFIRVNDAYAKVGGHQPDYFVGKNHFELYPHRENRVIFQRVVDTGVPFSVYEKPFESPDHPERGTTYWNWSLLPVRGTDGCVEGVVLSLVDVTERKQAEEKVELERARLRSILDAIPDGVYIVNQQYDIEYTNPVIEREFGVAGEKKCYAYFHDQVEACLWCKNQAVFEGGSVRWEWHSSKTGKTYEVFDTPLTNLDGSISKLKLTHDITHRKQAEAELEQRNRELQTVSAAEYKQRQVADTLRASAQALTQTLNLDHVIRTLLAQVRTLVNADTASVVLLEGETLLTVRAAEGYEKWTDPNRILSITVDGDNNPFYQRLLSSRKSLLIPDTAEEPNWEVYPGTEPIRNRIFVPIVIEDKIIGVVGLGKIEAGYFTEEHIRWAETLVGQAAVAIQNAWLFEQVRAGRERLQFLSRRLVEIQETERRFIARELHDHAGQTLTSLMLGLGALQKEADRPQTIRVRTAELRNMADNVLEDLHRLAINLRPTSLDHLGLVPALEQLIRAFTQDSPLQIKLKAVGIGEDERLPQDVETTLYRIAQESLTNVIRHAGAERADVVLKRRGDSVLILVEDDGHGFEVEPAKKSGHLGLLGMQERAEMLGGTLTVESIRGKGTTLVVEVPCAHTNHAGR